MVSSWIYQHKNHCMLVVKSRCSHLCLAPHFKPQFCHACFFPAGQNLRCRPCLVRNNEKCVNSWKCCISKWPHFSLHWRILPPIRIPYHSRVRTGHLHCPVRRRPHRLHLRHRRHHCRYRRSHLALPQQPARQFVQLESEHDFYCFAPQHRISNCRSLTQSAAKRQCSNVSNSK